MTKYKLSYPLLIYDIETAHVKGRFWRTGEQYIRGNQLLPNANFTRILTISYKWYGNPTITVLTCGVDGTNTAQMIKEFDAQVSKATVVLGKNNGRFDDSHINTNRLLYKGAPVPEWLYKSDDLEKQLRRYFNLQSYSLDYISELLGHSGKMKMEEQDWIDLEDYIEFNSITSCVKKGNENDLCLFFYNKSYNQVQKLGKKAFNKMIKYNKIDVVRSEEVLDDILPHVSLRHNAATKDKQVSPFACITCGSKDVTGKQIVYRGLTIRREFYCTSHKGYAGSRPFVWSPSKHERWTGPMGK